ncbi:MAG: hypothetical protein HOQ01_05510 [Lysobacter sp.]|nr:hypothetical protein [Lysobacter sp.]
MHRSLIAASVVAMLAAVSSLAAPRAHAAPPTIQQCIAPDGSTLYTDKPCRSIGARSVPMRGDLATRLVREQATEARVTGVEVAYIQPADTGTMRAARNAIGRRHAGGGCANTPTQLAMDLRGAFALGDVNRVAESFHWVGMSHRGAQATMTRLQKLMRQPLVDAHYYDIGSGWIASADDGAATQVDSGGVMQLTFGDGASARIEDFDVQRYAGCWFVRF